MKPKRQHKHRPDRGSECPTCNEAWLESVREDARAETREQCAQMFERELEEGLVGMTFREWCEWISARIRSGTW